MVPSLMRMLSRESLVHDWPLWKKDSPSEIDLERARYFLITDGLFLHGRTLFNDYLHK
jgi:hypothetical protein